MDISQISGIPTVEESDPYNYTSEPAGNMGRDEFLKMFLAQMEHQDPLNPMNAQEFASQLAQFSSLEQLYNLNTSLDDIKAFGEEQRRFEALSMIGKEIVASGEHIHLNAEGASKAELVLEEGPALCTAVITDAAGNEIRHLSLGYLENGSHEFEWDGNDDAGNRMPPGSYAFEVTGLSGDGEKVSPRTRTVGRVDRVSMEDESPVLYVGDIPVSLENIMDVRSSG
ncbi:MAG: flagellar hook assembly protein FlgD [Desulfobacteraceae bacterium]